MMNFDPLSYFKHLGDWIQKKKLGFLAQGIIYLAIFLFIYLVNDAFRFTHSLIKSNKIQTISELVSLSEQIEGNPELSEYIDRELQAEMQHQTYYEKGYAFIFNSSEVDSSNAVIQQLKNDNTNSVTSIDNLTFILSSSLFFLFLTVFCFLALPFLWVSQSFRKSLFQSFGLGIALLLIIALYNAVLYIIPNYTSFPNFVYYLINATVQLTLFALMMLNSQKKKTTNPK